MQRQLYLIRHCQTALPDEGRWCLGYTDWPLAPAGILQAQQLGQWFEDKVISALYASDLSRSAQTAQIIGEQLGLVPTLKPELREINMGQWDGLSFAEIKKRFPEDYQARGENLAEYLLPGGESFVQCAERAKETLAAIMRHSGGNVLVVAHAGLNRAFLWALSGKPQGGILSRTQAYGEINSLLYEDEHFIKIK